jgi:hypothetical protein
LDEALPPFNHLKLWKGVTYVAFYNTPERFVYTFNAVSFAANSTRYFKGPAGKIGKVVEIQAAVTTSFVGSSAPGEIKLGDGVTATKYADLVLGAAGAGPAAGAVVRATDVTKIGATAAIKGQDPTSLPFAFIAADQVVTVTNLAPTGSPAGVADVTIVVDFFEG